MDPRPHDHVEESLNKAPKHEHKAPAKKRVTRKKTVHAKTHAELELDAFHRKLTAIFNDLRTGFPHDIRSFNDQQIIALEKKIAKRERTIALQQAKVSE